MRSPMRQCRIGNKVQMPKPSRETRVDVAAWTARVVVGSLAFVMRAYDPRIYPWARCRRDRQKMAGKPIYTIDAIAERRAVRALIRKLAGLPGEASRGPLYPRKQTPSDATYSVRQRVAVRVAQHLRAAPGKPVCR